MTKGLDKKRILKSHDMDTTDDRQDDFVTKEDLQKIITEFEKNINDFDRRNRQNIALLKKSEEEIVKASKEVRHIKTKLSYFFEYIEEKLLPTSMDEANTYNRHNKSIVVIFIILTLISLHII